MKIKYEVNDGGYKFDLETNWDKGSPEYIAEDAAKDYYDNHDGWESSWPINIEVYDGDKSIGLCSVELEHDPTFSAIEI